MTVNPIIYQDTPGRRVLDLRPHGVDCIPVLGLSDFRMIQPGTDYHVHPKDVEICLCVRGNLAFETAERTYPFLPGSLFVSTEHEPHRMRHNPKGLVVYRILFRLPKRGKRILGLSPGETEWIVRSLQHLPKRLFKSTENIKNDFESLFDIYDHERLKAVRAVKLKAKILALLIGIIEAARLSPAKAPDRIADIMRTIREHPDRDYPVARLAAEAALSESGFSETFKRAAGLPPHGYLLSCRVSKAQKMLAADTHSIKFISDSLHFNSTQHFSNVFKRIVGMTPAAFRAQERCRQRGTPQACRI